MYSTTHNHVVFFTNPNAKHTEKMFSGRVSKAFNTGEKDDQGHDVFAYETYNARFVGKAREKAATLTDRDRITLTEWWVRNPYDKEKKRTNTYIMVMDFEIREQTAMQPDPSTNAGDYALLEDDDAQLPF